MAGSPFLFALSILVSGAAWVDDEQKTGGWRLGLEASAYLREHATNPVEWYPWGAEAFQRAKQLDRPIFLSIGYSSCHWCHVMRRESFSNDKVAAYMNANFVNIKIDREELPHVDAVYMDAVQQMTRSGGWPLSVWLTPDLTPFTGGTYFPPEKRYGRPGFMEILNAIATAWETRRDEIEKAGSGIIATLTQRQSTRGNAMDPRVFVETGVNQKIEQFDSERGGFGAHPKFPSPRLHTLLCALSLLSERPELKDIALKTLRAWAEGGIYDQVGGGFHRYSVDATWSVPHFEKMLYNQGMNAEAYLEIYRMTGSEDLKEVARGTLDALLRDFWVEEGGFAAAWDADSEEEEGTFYVWTPAQVNTVLGENDGRILCFYLGITETGNFEGGPRSVPSRRMTIPDVAKEFGLHLEQAQNKVDAGIERLFKARAERIPPHRDDKVILGWNALAVSALARGAIILGDARYLEAAQRAHAFAQKHLAPDEGFLRRYAGGKAAFPANLADVAFHLKATLDLYDATFDAAHVATARTLAERILRDYGPGEEPAENGGGFYDVKAGNEILLPRAKDFFDSAIPSGNATLARTLLRLHILTGESRYRTHAEGIIKEGIQALSGYPQASPELMLAALAMTSPVPEIAVVGDIRNPATRAFLEPARRGPVPFSVVAVRPPGPTGDRAAKAVSLLKDRAMVDGRPTAYLCLNFVCKAPQNDPKTFLAELDQAWKPKRKPSAPSSTPKD